MAGVLLGTIQFVDREVPDTIPWGGKQKLAIHKQIGGNRVIDAMGPDPHPIRWSGKFYGPSSPSRSRALDELRKSGSSVVLIWGSFSYLVVVEDFEVNYKHEWEMAYSITCEVVSDLPAVQFQPSLDQSINDDLSSLSSIGTS